MTKRKKCKEENDLLNAYVYFGQDWKDGSYNIGDWIMSHHS